MRRTVRFTQYAMTNGVLLGRMRRKEFRSCDVCGACVHLDDLAPHARFHERHNHLVGYRCNPGVRENGGDRLVSFDDDLAEVRSS